MHHTNVITYIFSKEIIFIGQVIGRITVCRISPTDKRVQALVRPRVLREVRAATQAKGRGGVVCVQRHRSDGAFCQP